MSTARSIDDPVARAYFELPPVEMDTAGARNDYVHLLVVKP